MLRALCGTIGRNNFVSIAREESDALASSRSVLLAQNRTQGIVPSEFLLGGLGRRGEPVLGGTAY